MAANLRNLSDFAYICSQKNNMNGIYILLTIFLYFGMLLLVARFTGKNSDNDAFFRGNRRSPWYVVSFGMIGASLSGVTFVSVPGMVRSIDMTYMQTCMGFFVGYLIIAHVLLPLYYKLNLTSIYSYLDDRIGRCSYKTGASFFSSFKDYRGGSASLSGLPDTSALCVRCIRGSVCRDGDRDCIADLAVHAQKRHSHDCVDRQLADLVPFAGIGIYNI